MLILIAGITGVVGKLCAEAALARGHSVRGLGRSPDKLGQDLLARLEDFEKSTGIYDLAALERAVSGVDAVICAYGFDPQLLVEGQRLLLRAAERAGVKIFHASSWNYGWTRGYLGQHESYDPFIAFAAHVRISANIKPIYMFTGAISEFTFYDECNKIWDKETKSFRYSGDKTQAVRYTTANDLAAYTVEAIQAQGAESGGHVRLQSFTASPADVVAAYQATHGGKAHAECLGSIEDAERMLAQARATTPLIDHKKYIGLSYAVHIGRGSWDYDPGDGARFPNVKPTDLKNWLSAHPDL